MTTGAKLMAGALLFALAGVLLLGVAMLRLRQARKALQTASSALVSRNQFFGMMAHEMLTPLQVIISSIELIELGKKLPEDDETLRRLRRSSQQLEAQMNDSVEFARLSGGQLKVVPMLFQPDLMMQIIVAEFEEAARERGVLLKVQGYPLPCPRISTDPARLRQIIGNLIANATKYASPGEVLCSLRVNEAAQQVSVAIIDQGPGFAASKEIWEPFVRGNQPRVGSGLGLAVVKLMAELLGGSANVVSHPGEGSAFIVQLPVEVEKIAPLAREMPAGATADRLRILLVQSNGEARASLQAILLAFGVQLELADNVQQAGFHLAATEFDGVLTDLRLADGDAPAVASQARTATSANLRTPLVAFSCVTEVAADERFAAQFAGPMTATKLRSALLFFS